MKTATILLLSFSLGLIARADEDQESKNEELRWRAARLSIYNKAEAQIQMSYPSPEERVAAWNKWIADDLTRLSKEGAYEGFPAIPLARLLATKDQSEAAKILTEQFSIPIDATAPDAAEKMASVTRDIIKGAKLGLEMSGMQGRRMDELIQRFGHPTVIAKPENFGIRFRDFDKAVVVFCYHLARKEVFIDENGSILMVARWKSWKYEDGGKE